MSKWFIFLFNLCSGCLNIYLGVVQGEWRLWLGVIQVLLALSVLLVIFWGRRQDILRMKKRME